MKKFLVARPPVLSRVEKYKPLKAFFANPADDPLSRIFSVDWVTYNVDVWVELLGHLKDKPNLRYLEIGVYEGRSTAWMMNNIFTSPTSHITVVDIFPGEAEERFVANLKIAADYKGELNVLKGPSQSILKNLPENSFDVIYVDGDHTAPGVLADAVLAWSLLKEGGILIFDDYEMRLDLDELDLPKVSVDAFVYIYQDQLEVLHYFYQYIVRKKHQSEIEATRLDKTLRLTDKNGLFGSASNNSLSRFVLRLGERIWSKRPKFF